MRYFCGVDIGASALKLVVIDEEGRTVAGRSGARAWTMPRPPIAAWREALAAAGLTRDQIHAARVHRLRPG